MSFAAGLRSVQGISNTTQGIADTLGRLGTGSYWSQLKPASYAGIPFAVLEGTSRFGRRNVVHQYPFRDDPWVEDLGREGRRIELSGFLIGDDVIAQRKALIDACEASGDFDLVHPTLGVRSVALVDFASTERWDQGRMFEVQFAFVEQGRRRFPAVTAAGADATDAAAGKADDNSLASFVSRSYNALKSGVSAANEAARQANAWAQRALQAGNDATSLLNLAVSLPGTFGRLLGQARGVRLGQLVPVRNALTVRSLEGASSTARVQLASAAGGLVTAGANLGPTSGDAFATAAKGVAGAISAAAPTPGDGLRALAQLAAFTPVGSAPTADAQTMRGAAADTFRRAAVVEMARVASLYEPASADDAAAVRDLVSGALDAEITTAGDQGEDDVFSALRALRTATVRDLNTRGALLPSLRTVNTGRPVPSLVLAQRLYQDPGRADDLVLRANPAHPAFMPVQFTALSA